MMREELGPEVCDSLVPLVDGGVRVHTIVGLMHDTCSTANHVTELMSELRVEQARLYHGDDEWDTADPCMKEVHNFLCGNHSLILLLIVSITYTTPTWNGNWVRLCDRRVPVRVGMCG